MTRREGEQAARGRLLLQDLRELQQPLGIGRRGDHQLDREIAAARQRRRRGDEDLDAGDLRNLGLHLRQNLGDGPVAFRPGFDHHAAEAIGTDGRTDRRREQQLEGQRRFRHVEHDLFGGRAIHRVLVGRGVGGGVDDTEQHALVFGRRQLVGREGVHRDRAQADHEPDQVDRRPGVQRRCRAARP